MNKENDLDKTTATSSHLDIRSNKTTAVRTRTTTKTAKKVRILWISRHPPLPKQIDELRRIFGDFDLVQYAGFVRDSNHVVELMRSYGADDVVVIIPYSIIYRLVKEFGIHPIFPEMEELKDDEGPADYVDVGSGRRYRFKRFVRIMDFNIVYEVL